MKKAKNTAPAMPHQRMEEGKDPDNDGDPGMPEDAASEKREMRHDMPQDMRRASRKSGARVL